jgi:hypothetical protein
MDLHGQILNNVFSGYNPTITYDGNNIWVAFVNYDPVNQYPYVGWGKRIGSGQWQIRQGPTGFNPIIIYARPSSWQPEGIYLGFSSYRTAGKGGPPQNPFSKVCLYWINKNIIYQFERKNCDSIDFSIGTPPPFTLGKIIENGERVIMVYNLPQQNLKYMDISTKDTLKVYDPYTATWWFGTGYSPFIGNGNLCCFINDGIKIIKYDQEYYKKWIWYPDYASQLGYGDGFNPQILTGGGISILCFEKDNDIYYQKIKRAIAPPVKISMLPKIEGRKKPNLILRQTSSGIYVGVLHLVHLLSHSMIIYRERFIPLPIPNPIEDHISLLDIPPNNTPRISLFDNSLHILYSKNDSVFDAILKGNEILKKFLGYGKNPSLFSYKGNLYTIWAYNDTIGLEEIRFSKYDTSWSSYLMSYTNVQTYQWGIGAPSFYIQNDTGYVVFESTWGPTYHLPPVGGVYPMIIKLWNGKLLTSVKFPLNTPSNYEILYTDFIEISPETLQIVRPIFYDSVVPILISPSIVSDKGISNIIWDGINKFLKIYKIGNDTIIKIIYPEYGNVKEPYAFKENSIVKFLWVEYDKFYMMKQKINFT